MSTFNNRRKIHKHMKDGNIVEVTELDGVRSMHLGSEVIQSSMSVKDPFELVLPYSHGMMAYMLFSPMAKNLTVVGLGGGSVSKYLWKYCTNIKQTVLEINPEVIRIARSHFFLPENDERLQVIEGDGIHYIQNHVGESEVLMIDAFGSCGLLPEFCSPAFFDDCEQALTPNGLFLMNLWGSDKNFDIYLQRIQQAFQNRVFVLPTGRQGNIIVLAFKPELNVPNFSMIMHRARMAQQQHTVPLLSLFERLMDKPQINPSNQYQQPSTEFDFKLSIKLVKK